MTKHAEQRETNTAEGGWGSSGREALSHVVELMDVLRGIKGSLSSLWVNHSNLLHAFKKGLPDAAAEVRAYALLC